MSDEGDYVGQVIPDVTGYRAVCGVGRCGWSLQKRGSDRAEAEKSLRLHAALIHPQPIRVYRTEPTP